MKKYLGFILVVILLFLFEITAYADNMEDTYKEMTEDLQEGIEYEIKDELKEYDIDIDDPTSLKDFDIRDIFHKILSALSVNVGQAISLIVKIIILIIISSLVRNCIPNNNSVNEIFYFISLVTAATVIMSILQDCISLSVYALSTMNTFMKCYVPVFTSIVITSGNITSGNGYYAIMFLICEISSIIANTFVVPVLSIIICMSIVGAINNDFPFTKVAESIKKLVQWILGAIMTITVAVLSIRSIIGSAVDNVTTRSAKYVVSTFVPIIGSAVSDALMTVKGSIGVIKSGIGSVGIVVLFFIIVPPIATVIVMRTSIIICQMIADIFDEKSISTLMSSFSSVLSICLSTVVCVSIMFILSTALMLMMNT